MNPRYAFALLRITKTPGFFPVLQDWQASIRMHFIHAAYETGLLKAMKKPCTRESLLEKLAVQRPALLDALLDVGLATKELALENGMFRIRGKRSASVLDARGDMLAAMIQASVTYYNDIYRDAGRRLHGSDLGDDLGRIGDLVARVSKIAEPVVKDFIAAIVRGKSPMRVLDVGCGSGILLRSAHNANAHATGTGIDIDGAVVRQARQNLVSWGLADRFEIRHGDIRHPEDLAGPFDLITLYNILYYFNEEERPDLLNRLRQKISETGALAIAMSFRSKGRDVTSANLNMVNSSLQGLTPLPDLEDITSLLKQCGLGQIKIHRFIPGSTFYGIIAQTGTVTRGPVRNR